MKNMFDKKMILGFVLLCTGVVGPWSFAHGMKNKAKPHQNGKMSDSLS